MEIELLSFLSPTNWKSNGSGIISRETKIRGKNEEN